MKNLNDLTADEIRSLYLRLDWWVGALVLSIFCLSMQMADMAAKKQSTEPPQYTYYPPRI